MEPQKNSYIKERIIDRYFDGGRYYPGAYKREGLQAILDFNEKFPISLCVDHTFYEPRNFQRYLVLKHKLAKYAGEKVIDVGSRDDSAKRSLGKDVTLIDKNNTSLDRWDWEKSPIPFPDKSFDTVICFDTLEHINDIHRSLRDLMRISRETVIISLPNCWKKQIKKFATLSAGQASYGLPPEKPMDRHKWFFTTEDIDNFLVYNATTNPEPFEAIDVVYHAPKTRLWHKLSFWLLKMLPKNIFKNYFVETTFIVLRRKS